jgi:hypothetical protein
MEFKLKEGLHTYYYDTGIRAANGRTYHGIKVGVWIYFDIFGRVIQSKMERSMESFQNSTNPFNDYTSSWIISLLESDTEDE